jgi:CheY-like chemotaxis protein
MNRHLFCKALRRRIPNIIIIESENGSQAVAAVKKSIDEGTPLHAIFMDKEMPVMNGHDATSKIRALGFTNLVVGVSGNALAADQAEFLDSGADFVLPKPVNIPMLLALLRTHFPEEVGKPA